MAKKKKKRIHGATAAMQVLESAGVSFTVHEYEHADGETSFGVEAAAALGRSESQVFKTLMISHEKNYAICVVPVAGRVSLKNAAASLGWKSAKMADPAVAERRTGYVVGGISPLGQKTPHRTLVDQTAQSFDTILISGGKRGLDLELSPADLLKLTGGSFADLAIS